MAVNSRQKGHTKKAYSQLWTFASGVTVEGGLCFMGHGEQGGLRFMGHGEQGGLSPFLIGQMFVREPSWKYSANLVGS